MVTKTKEVTMPVTDEVKEVIGLEEFMNDLANDGEAIHPPDEFKWVRLEDIKDELAAPFDPRMIEFLPKGKQDNPKANALAYVAWNEYTKRLNRLAYGHWSTRIVGVYGEGERTVVSVGVEICGTCHEDISDPDNPTSAYATALKRACSKFGLGLYLYDMPREFLQKSTEFGKAFVEDNLSIAVRYYKALGIPVSQEVEDELAKRPKASYPQSSGTRYENTPSERQSTTYQTTQIGSGKRPTEKMIAALVERNRVPRSFVDTIDYDTASAMMNDIIQNKVSLRDLANKYQFSLPSDGLPIRS